MKEGGMQKIPTRKDNEHKSNEENTTLKSNTVFSQIMI
jgi:hypothetical protein